MRKTQLVMTMAVMGVMASMAVGCGKKDTTPVTSAAVTTEAATEVESSEVATEADADMATPSEQEVIAAGDPYEQIDFTIYKQAEQGDDGETYTYGYVDNADEKIVYIADGPIHLETEEKLNTGDYIKFVAKDGVGMSYPAYVVAVKSEVVDKADALVDDAFFTDLASALPEKVENEDGTVTYAAMMWQSWSQADKTWLVETHEGKFIVDVSSVENMDDIRVGDLYYITCSGESDKALPATLLDVNKVEVINDEEAATSISDNISDVVIKHHVAINGPIDSVDAQVVDEAVEQAVINPETEVNADNVAETSETTVEATEVEENAETQVTESKAE